MLGGSFPGWGAFLRPNRSLGIASAVKRTWANPGFSEITQASVSLNSRLQASWSPELGEQRVGDLGARHRSPLWAELCALLTPWHKQHRSELSILCGAGRARPASPPRVPSWAGGPAPSRTSRPGPL